MELLSPAGRWESMEAAVQNGAGAVYLGCGDLNARRGAKNFTPQELPAAVQYCHLRGVRLYLTLNTLPSDRELDSARDMLLLSSRCGVDGVIVQDWGLAAPPSSLLSGPACPAPVTAFSTLSCSLSVCFTDVPPVGFGKPRPHAPAALFRRAGPSLGFPASYK